MILQHSGNGNVPFLYRGTNASEYSGTSDSITGFLPLSASFL